KIVQSIYVLKGGINLIAFLGVISFFIFIIFGIMFIWSLIKKNGKAKRNILISGISFILVIFLVVIDSDGSNFIEVEDETFVAEEKAEKEKAEKAKAEKEKAEKEKVEKEKAEKEKAEKEKAEKEKAEKEKGEKEKAEKKKAEKEKVEKEKAEKEKAKKENSKSIDEKIKKYDVVEEAEMDNGELILTYEPGMGWSENSLFLTVYDSFEVTNQAFKDDSVDSVLNIIQGVMVDQKGNEEKIKKYDGVEDAEIDNGEIILTYEPGMGWSENSLFLTVYDSFEVTNQAFKDDSVDSVLNLIQGVMVDQKGNEELKDMITYR